PHRRLLVSAWRHANRCVLADGETAEGRVGAGPGCRAVSRAWLIEGLRLHQQLGADRTDQNHRDARDAEGHRSAEVIETVTVQYRADAAADEEREGMKRHRGASGRWRELCDVDLNAGVQHV